MLCHPIVGNLEMVLNDLQFRKWLYQDGRLKAYSVVNTIEAESSIGDSATKENRMLLLFLSRFLVYCS